jgi:hypothetical protein
MVYREHWAPAANPAGTKLRQRVNDTGLSLDPRFGTRSEASANGLVLIDADEDLFALEAAEVALEMWGGHPGTARKRFTVNGRGRYRVTDPGTEGGHCAYTYPVVPVAVRDLVRGRNALQFVCERGSSFWGHFIMDNACLRLMLSAEHPERRAVAPLEEARVAAGTAGDAEALDLALEIPAGAAAAARRILGVEYIGRYTDYDDTGSGRGLGWHGYTQDRLARGHLGGSATPPYAARWDTSMVPDQQAVALAARIRLDGGLVVRTAVTSVRLPRRGARVLLAGCRRMPRPFWSRAGEVRLARIDLPVEPTAIERAQLRVRIWDGGEGTVFDPFTLNGRAIEVTSRRAHHDLVSTAVAVDPAHLVRGANEIRVFSDTEHHGIEVLLPGPALVVRTGR